MTARTRAKLKRWLATGTAAAGVSASLASLSIAEAGWWSTSKDRQASGKPEMLAPAPVRNGQALQISDPLIHQTVSRRRQRRQQILEELRTGSGLKETAEPQSPPAPQLAPQQQLREAAPETDEPDFSPALTPSAGATGPQFSFEQPVQQSAQAAEPQELTPIQRELQRLYAEQGMQMPDMTGAGQQQRLQIQQPQVVPVQPVQPAPAVASSQPAPSIASSEPAEEAPPAEAPKRKGVLGFFGFKKKGDVETPPVEPRPYVPQSTPDAFADVPDDSGLVEVDDVELDEVELDDAEPMGIVDDEAATVELDSMPVDETDVEPAPLHPLRARNYQAELFGQPDAEEPAGRVMIPDEPAAVEESSDAEFSFEGAQDAEIEEDLGLTGEPSPFMAQPATAVPEAMPAQPATPAPAAEDPYTGLKLEENPFEEGAGPVPLPPEDPFATKASIREAKPEPKLTAASHERPKVGRSISLKKERIASRSTQPGLKGFCPVRLRDDRELSDGVAEFRSEYEGKTYYLSSAEALQKFLTNPTRYAPTEHGMDVVERYKSKTELEGSLDHSVWYKGRLYLFSTVESLQAFVATPSLYAAD